MVGAPEPSDTLTPSTAPGTPVVTVREVRKSFRRGAEIVHALRGVDLDVPAGRVVGIAGASGSGKSTLLAVICGWERPDAGSVTHVRGPGADLPWSELAIVPQTLGLLDDLPVLDNVLLPARLARLAGGDHRDRARELLARLGVDHLRRRYSDEISLGEQQRITLARALLLRPRLLLADEPTAHQDHAWAEVALDLIREQADDGGAAIVVSHHRQALDRADRLLTLRDGKWHDTDAP